MTIDARRAGRYPAENATTPNTTAAPPIAIGSCPSRPNNIDRAARPAAIAAAGVGGVAGQEQVANRAEPQVRAEAIGEGDPSGGGGSSVTVPEPLPQRANKGSERVENCRRSHQADSK